MSLFLSNNVFVNRTFKNVPKTFDDTQNNLIIKCRKEKKTKTNQNKTKEKKQKKTKTKQSPKKNKNKKPNKLQKYLGNILCLVFIFFFLINTGYDSETFRFKAWK